MDAPYDLASGQPLWKWGLENDCIMIYRDKWQRLMVALHWTIAVYSLYIYKTHMSCKIWPLVQYRIWFVPHRAGNIIFTLKKVFIFHCFFWSKIVNSTRRLIPFENACCQIKFRYQSKVCGPCCPCKMRTEFDICKFDLTDLSHENLYLRLCWKTEAKLDTTIPHRGLMKRGGRIATLHFVKTRPFFDSYVDD